MNFNTIYTKDKEIIKVDILKSIDIQIADLIFNEKIKLLVHFKDENHRIFKSEILTIEGGDYNNWGFTDDYLVDLVLQKLGIERL